MTVAGLPFHCALLGIVTVLLHCVLALLGVVTVLLQCVFALLGTLLHWVSVGVAVLVHCCVFVGDMLLLFHCTLVGSVYFVAVMGTLFHKSSVNDDLDCKNMQITTKFL